jgi:hypothetical protein
MIIFGFDLTPYMPFIYALLTGIAWATYGFITKTSETDFNKIKYLSTIVTALIVVTVMWTAGIPLEQATFEQQMVAYLAFTVGLERLFNRIAAWLASRNNNQTKRASVSTGNTDVVFDISPEGDILVGTEIILTDINHNIDYVSWGDGKIWRWSAGDAPYIARHRYEKAGTFTIQAIAKDKSSTEKTVTVVASGPPTKKSWLELLIEYIKSLFRMK